MLQIDNLVKEYPGTLAVNDLSFQLDQGRICGFIGPNGAGKTTTMRIIATLEEPTLGDVYVDGCSIAEEPYKIRRMIGFMPDHLGVYPSMTVRDYLEFYARAYEIEPTSRGNRIDGIMDFTGLDSIAEKEVEALSKGMRQRLNLGRALINDPKVMVMDEPAAGLDPRARVELRFLIKALAEQGKTVFVSSHILTELSEICDSMLIIDHGEQVMFGSFDEIQEQLQTGFEITVTLIEADQLNGLERFLLEQPHVENVRMEEGSRLSFTFGKDKTQISALLRDMMN
ncbi:ATP-binding cassette domain-containing protein, partial [bacterium]|nr:ATP-binding cassette domain-containing protein [bacterium]